MDVKFGDSWASRDARLVNGLPLERMANPCQRRPPASVVRLDHLGNPIDSPGVVSERGLPLKPCGHICDCPCADLRSRLHIPPVPAPLPIASLANAPPPTDDATDLEPEPPTIEQYLAALNALHAANEHVKAARHAWHQDQATTNSSAKARNVPSPSSGDHSPVAACNLVAPSSDLSPDGAALHGAPSSPPPQTDAVWFNDSAETGDTHLGSRRIRPGAPLPRLRYVSAAEGQYPAAGAAAARAGVLTHSLSTDLRFALSDDGGTLLATAVRDHIIQTAHDDDTTAEPPFCLWRTLWA